MNALKFKTYFVCFLILFSSLVLAACVRSKISEKEKFALTQNFELPTPIKPEHALVYFIYRKDMNSHHYFPKAHFFCTPSTAERYKREKSPASSVFAIFTLGLSNLNPLKNKIPVAQLSRGKFTAKYFQPGYYEVFANVLDKGILTNDRMWCQLRLEAGEVYFVNLAVKYSDTGYTPLFMLDLFESQSILEGKYAISKNPVEVISK